MLMGRNKIKIFLSKSLTAWPRYFGANVELDDLKDFDALRLRLTAVVMSGRLVNLTTFFLGSSKCTYFRQ